MMKEQGVIQLVDMEYSLSSRYPDVISRVVLLVWMREKLYGPLGQMVGNRLCVYVGSLIMNYLVGVFSSLICDVRYMVP